MFQWQRIINRYVLVSFRDVAINEKLGELGDNVYYDMLQSWRHGRKVPLHGRKLSLL